jgi:hypothetical protein
MSTLRFSLPVALAVLVLLNAGERVLAAEETAPQSRARLRWMASRLRRTSRIDSVRKLLVESHLINVR